MSAPVNKNKSTYLPHFDGSYTDPRLSRAERLQFSKERKEKIDRAFEFLANLHTLPRRINKKTSFNPPCNNIVCNLGAYLMSHPLDIMMRSFCCCFISKDPRDIRMIPEEAADTLEGTTEQFERNTIGVCCIAPAVIIGTPFIKAGELATKLLAIFSSLVITDTAGTNTYVFSGDIGVVPNGRGSLIVQGGIRVEAINVIQSAYAELNDRLKERWDEAQTYEDKMLIATQCRLIRENWLIIYDGIIDCGIKSSSVEKVILAQFSNTINKVLDEYEDMRRPEERVASPIAQLRMIEPIQPHDRLL